MKSLYSLIRSTKCTLLFCAAFFSMSSFAQNGTQTGTDDLTEVGVENSREATRIMQTTACPEDFYGVPVPKSGKLCQIFATNLPASMVFHIPQNVKSTVDYYQNLSQFNSAKETKDRFLLQSIDNNVTVIVSVDGSGSQVDVLVKERLKP